MCGIYDLVPLIQTSLNDPLKLDEESATALSPMLNKIKGGDSIFFVITAQDESPPLRTQAKDMRDHLVECGVESRYICLKDIDHFDIIENLSDENFELTKLIIENILKSIVNYCRY